MAFSNLALPFFPEKSEAVLPTEASSASAVLDADSAPAVPDSPPPPPDSIQKSGKKN